MNKKIVSIKIVSIMLAVIMIAAALPFAVSANPDPDLVESGECGENCTWWFYDDGTLAIAGWGEMTEADSYLLPWHEKYQKSITKVVIGDEITLIAHDAFADCENVSSAEIGKNVKEIGDSAFLNCKALKKANVSLPDSPMLLGYGIFTGTALYDAAASWQGGLLYVGDHLFEAKKDTAGNVTVKEGTLSLASCAFENCAGLTNVSLPASLKVIGSCAFRYCKKLEGVNIPYGVKELLGDTFEDCASLKGIEIPASVAAIGYDAFSGCKSLTEVKIPASVKEIGTDAFFLCTSLNKATVYSSNAKIDQNAFGVIKYGAYLDPDTINPEFVMRCYKNSTASAYAKKYGLKTEFMERLYIVGFKPGNTIDDYRKKFPRYEVEFKDVKGDLITAGPIFTGLRVRLLNSVGDDDYEFVVTGDVDGNGKIDSTDYITLKRHILNISALFGAYEAAADTDESGIIDTTDCVRMKRAILGLGE